MSSGRDEMMDKWGDDEQQWIIWTKKQLQRMFGYKQTLIDELKRVDNEIIRMLKEVENDQL